MLVARVVLHYRGCGVFDKGVFGRALAAACERFTAEQETEHHDSRAGQDRESRVPTVGHAEVWLDKNKDAEDDDRHFFRHIDILLALDDYDKLPSLLIFVGDKVGRHFGG